MIESKRTVKPAWFVAGGVALAVILAAVVIITPRYRRVQAITAIREHGGLVLTTSTGPDWLESFPRANLYFATVTGVAVNQPALTSEGVQTVMAAVEQFRELESLNLERTPVGDAEMVAIQGLPRLRDLNLWGTQVGDSGVERLASRTDLTHLILADTRVTDQALSAIGRMRNLESLTLDGTEITDDGLTELSGLTKLKHLSVSNTGVTEFGLSDLATSIPELSAYDD